jgi:ATP-dependent protease HslVU (ClpYQ) ATPase subunit
VCVPLLQGRLPVRVELAGLTAEDFYRILTEPQHNMIKQQQVLLATEGVDLVFTDGAIRAIAEAAHQANQLLDNIGARRLHTVVERVLADISYSAPERVAAQQAQQQQVEAGAPASSSADASTLPSTSSKGAKSGGKAGAAARSGSSRGSKASRQDTSSSKEAISSSKDSSKAVPLLQYVVTEDMVHSCMAEVLKQKDLSRYML